MNNEQLETELKQAVMELNEAKNHWDTFKENKAAWDDAAVRWAKARDKALHLEKLLEGSTK